MDSSSTDEEDYGDEGTRLPDIEATEINLRQPKKAAYEEEPSEQAQEEDLEIDEDNDQDKSNLEIFEHRQKSTTDGAQNTA